MKIAILGTRGIPARYGGFETFAEKLAVGLVNRGFDVTVFCEAEGACPETFHGVSLQYRPAPKLGPLETILYDIRCLWAARKGYDVVYMLGYGAAPFCVIPRLWGSRVWINPDGLEWARAKWNFVARTYFRLMEWCSVRMVGRVVADAQAIADVLTERHGTISNCSVIRYGCEVVENPPPVTPLAQWGVDPGDYSIVVCRLEPENHVVEILRAYQRSQSKRQLIVLGNHRAPTEYVQLLLKIRDPRIRLVGTVYDAAVLTALRFHAFAYFHGHSVGGTNPSLLEAMGCRNLIVAHDNRFNRETLQTAGLFFRNEDDLTATINRIEREEGETEKLRQAAWLRARDAYSWDGIVSQYAELLSQPAR